LKTLLAEVAKLDPNHQMVIGVHLQNEMTQGMDFSPVANSHYDNDKVPQEVIDFLKTYYDTPTHLSDKQSWVIHTSWNSCGRPTSGKWKDVLMRRDISPDNTSARQMMGVYYTGRYLDIVAATAKQGLNIPIYCNAWMGVSATDLIQFDIFHVGAPHIDGIAGDNPDWEGVQRLYKRPWNVVAAPSEFIMPECHFSAIADGAFGFGQWLSPDFELNAYRPVNMMILSMEPLLVKKNLDGTSLLAFYQIPDSWGCAAHPKSGETWEKPFQDMIAKFTTTTTAAQNKTFNTTGQVLNGNGLIMKMAADEYVVTSTKIDVELRYADGRPSG